MHSISAPHQIHHYIPFKFPKPLVSFRSLSQRKKIDPPNRHLSPTPPWITPQTPDGHPESPPCSGWQRHLRHLLLLHTGSQCSHIFFSSCFRSDSSAFACFTKLFPISSIFAFKSALSLDPIWRSCCNFALALFISSSSGFREGYLTLSSACLRWASFTENYCR